MRWSRRRWSQMGSRNRVAVTAVGAALLTASCGGAADDNTADDHQVVDIVVFAAASLTEAFTEIGEAFTDAEPTADVTFSFAASSQLAAQIGEGAPADVFASADAITMQRVVDAGGTAGDPVVFATNRAVIVVEPGNPRGISGLADLARIDAEEDLVVVTCAPEVPCGSYASQIAETAGVEIRSDSLEPNVKAVVTKVGLGEADAGIAYATDVPAADGDVEAVEIPDDLNVAADYPIAVTAGADAGAGAFVEFVLGDTGRRILVDRGFSVP